MLEISVRSLQGGCAELQTGEAVLVTGLVTVDFQAAQPASSVKVVKLFSTSSSTSSHRLRCATSSALRNVTPLLVLCVLPRNSTGVAGILTRAVVETLGGSKVVLKGNSPLLFNIVELFPKRHSRVPQDPTKAMTSTTIATTAGALKEKHTACAGRRLFLPALIHSSSSSFPSFSEEEDREIEGFFPVSLYENSSQMSLKSNEFNVTGRFVNKQQHAVKRTQKWRESSLQLKLKWGRGIPAAAAPWDDRGTSENVCSVLCAVCFMLCVHVLLSQ